MYWGRYLVGSERRLQKVVYWSATRFVLFAKWYKDDQIKDYEVGGPSGMYGGEEKFIQGFSGETLRYHLENLGVDWRMY